MDNTIPETLTALAHDHVGAVGRNQKRIGELVDFAQAMKGEVGPLAAAYYSAIVSARMPAQWRDAFLAELAVRILETKTSVG